MFYRHIIATVLAALSVAFAAGQPRTSAATMELRAQSRDQEGRLVQQTLAFDPAKTAVVVIDMWDQHWCPTYTERVGEPRAADEPDARRRPASWACRSCSRRPTWSASTGTHPQRKAMQAVPAAAGAGEIGLHRPAAAAHRLLRVRARAALQGRQASGPGSTPALQIAEGDLIGDCNNGRELLNLCAARQIDTLLYMGVASNMCVQYRSMGMRNMKDHGLRVLVVADLVEAITRTGSTPTGKKNLNFTPAGGTARIQDTSSSTWPPRSRAGSCLRRPAWRRTPPTRGRTSCSSPPRPNTRARRRCPSSPESNSTATSTAPASPPPAPKAAAATTSRAWRPSTTPICVVLAMRRRSLPVVQMDHLERYLRAGKPLVALRTSVGAVPDQKDPEPGYVVWDRFDERGAGLQLSRLQSPSRGRPAATCGPARGGRPSDPRWRGAKFHSPCWIYRQRPLAGRPRRYSWAAGRRRPRGTGGLDQHVDGGRVFYTTLGHPGDFENESFNRMLVNAVRWALGRGT